MIAHLDGIVSGVAPDGANGVNAEWEHGQGPGMYIEEQRHGEEAIIAGLVIGKPLGILLACAFALGWAGRHGAFTDAAAVARGLRA